MKSKIEYKKCIKDSSGIYFIEKYPLKSINSFTWGAHAEHLTEKQKELLRSIDECKHTFVIKGRCCGYSMTILTKMVYDVVMSEGNENFLLYCGSFGCSMSMLKGIESLIGQVPAELWTIEPEGRKIVKKHGGSLEFFNGCNVITVNHPKDLKEDIKNVKAVYMDEWLFPDNAKIMLELLKLGYYNDSKFIMGSSPNNSDNLGYEEARKFEEMARLNGNENRLIYMGPSSMNEITDRLLKMKKRGFISEDMKDEFYGIIKKTEVFDGVKYDNNRING